MDFNLNHIKKVYIEIHSQCNRQCAWCPNKFLNRNFYEEMDEKLFLNILNQLYQNGFCNLSNSKFELVDNFPTIALLGYSEPFLNSELLKKRVNQIFDIFPDTLCVETASNGDFITKESLNELYLTNILISDYDNKGIEYWKKRLKDLDILVIDINEELEIIYGIHRYINSITVQCNWTKNHLIENRGGILKPEDLKEVKFKNNCNGRNSLCYEPEYFINIDYKGNVLPCCHIREDYKDHQQYCFGNLNYNTLEEIFTSDKVLNFQNNLRNMNFPNPCKFCHKERFEKLIGAPSGLELK